MVMHTYMSIYTKGKKLATGEKGTGKGGKKDLFGEVNVH